jgi:hypothetical protein
VEVVNLLISGLIPGAFPIDFRFLGN